MSRLNEQRMRMACLLLAATAGVALVAAPARAQDAVPDPGPRTTIGDGTPSEALPPPRSDHDPRPPVAAPAVPAPGVTKQAGVGGTQAYGRAGVLELGGSGGFAAASNFQRYEFSPSIGYFLMDNLEMSLLTAFNYFNVDSVDGKPSASATEVKALFEPSFHIPFSDVAFGFLGLGAGVNYITGHEAGFALQPRLGANFLIGRSGVLTPALTVAYSTVDALQTPAGTVLAIQTSYGMNIGYTVMW